MAPWVRTRLRAVRVSTWLTAALVLVAVFLAAGLPRALDRAADGALRERLASGGRDGAVVTATSLRLGAQGGGSPALQLDVLAQELERRVTDPLRPTGLGAVYGSTTRADRSLPGPGLPRPNGMAPVLGLAYLHGVGGRAALAAGRWPAAVADGADFEVALSEPVARTFGVSVGAVLDAGTDASMSPPRHFRATVVGVFAAADPASPFWAGTDCLVEACLSSTVALGERIRYWRAAALVGPGELADLGFWSGKSPQDFVRVPVDVSAARADRLPRWRAAVGSLTGGPERTALQVAAGRPDVQVRSRLSELLETAAERQSAVAPLTVLGPAGAAGVGLTVLLLAAALAAERRAGELRLLRARGASRGGVLRRLLGESAATALPAAVLGTALALLVLPSPRWGAAVLAAGVTAAVALLVFPLRAALFPERGTEPGTEPGAAAGRRRVVAELSALALAAGAVVAVRRRGVAPAGAGVDPLLVGAPLLIALVGALLLARLLPPLVGAASRRAARRRGAVGFLALARASRPAVLPLLALLLAVSTAGFGATVLESVDAGRLRAVRAETGADARVTARTVLPDGFGRAAGELPDVRAGVSAWTDRAASVAKPDGTVLAEVTLLVVDPQQYAALARRNGQPAIDPRPLAGGGPDGVPALVTPGLAGRLGAGPHPLHTGQSVLPFRLAGVLPAGGGPALGAGEAVVLPVGQASERVAALGRSNLWLGTGTPRADRLRELLRRLDPASAPESGAYAVRTGAEESERLAADPLQRSAARVFGWSVLAAGAFAALAVLLTLARSGPERAALLARLRTMGLRPRQGLAVVLLESLPTALAAAVAGALLAVGTTVLLGPALDLSALVGAPATGGVSPSAAAVLTWSLALAALFAATVAAEALVAGRRQIGTELRAGDAR
ncbi:hypothetical protein KSE_01370 [Kitasatospora setae KM-6054]|uniref:ABC3 transporter permease protein domain-containing protein n=1 Tax=Kitasatospora setae (strain ATCC 33774 / DSM 43861 / JCM 3304 / KCC A-0304 / NBRC 14216 / KM-6054) TaxID=452652 RepID=E4N457_KITSK|nr:hypothetical protein KSE_01370 [Kitasatospora setae KM-6054]